eukprot:SAG22_NODE_264_length_13353_cov_34.575298_2_plen_240_part_00
MGVYDWAHETFVNVTVPTPVDRGQGVAYGQLSHQKVDDGSTAASGADSRTIHVSWLNGRSEATAHGPNCATGGQLTSFRDMRYDPRLGATGALVENPIEEYLALRGKRPVFNVSSTVLRADAPHVVVGEMGSNKAMDIEFEIALPNKAGAAVAVGVRCEKGDAPECAQGTVVTLTQSAMPSNGSSPARRMAVASVSRWRDCQSPAFRARAGRGVRNTRRRGEHRAASDDGHEVDRDFCW